MSIISTMPIVFIMSWPKSREEQLGAMRNLCMKIWVSIWQARRGMTFQICFPINLYYNPGLRERLSWVDRENRVMCSVCKRNWIYLPKTSKATQGSSWAMMTLGRVFSEHFGPPQWCAALVDSQFDCLCPSLGTETINPLVSLVISFSGAMWQGPRVALSSFFKVPCLPVFVTG